MRGDHPITIAIAIAIPIAIAKRFAFAWIENAPATVIAV